MYILSILRHTYWDSTRPMRFLTILLYPLAAFGIWAAYEMQSTDMDWMFHILPGVPEVCHAAGWGLIVAYIFCARVLGLFFMEGYKWTLRTTPLLGVIFWSCLLASNLHDPNTLAFGPMFGICALIETWLLSRNWLETQ